MASDSPALSNNSADATPTATPARPPVVGTSSGNTTTINSSSINTSKNLRGLNKPRCIKCGNVARSRCPYQSCKSCCAKDQNPCHIHVLKGNSSFPDKTPSLSSPSLDQHPNETSSSGNSHRVTSLRQLSNNFSQFNNLQTPVRSRKPLTKKEAMQINEWRFSKLKEYKDRNIEIENEAFDRYLQNISLLEEVFATNSQAEESTKGDPLDLASGKSEMISKLKLRLKADPIRMENLRDRMHFIVNNGLQKLKRFEIHNVDEEAELVNQPKKARYSALDDLNKKLSNARTEDDIKACQLLKAQIFNHQPKKPSEESDNIEIPGPKSEILSELEPEPEPEPEPKSECSVSKPFSTATIDQEALKRLDAHFCSLEQIEQL